MAYYDTAIGKEQEGRAEGISGAVDIYRDEMGLDDKTIMGKIAACFHLTAEQAAEYVRLSQET